MSTAALALFLIARATGAQPIDSAMLMECSAKPDDAERLACYDRTLAASAQGRAVAEARERAAAERRPSRQAAAAADAAAARARAEQEKLAAFGRESMPADQRPDRPSDDLDILNAKISEVLVSQQSGSATFVLDNGMVWRQTEARPLPPIRPGTDVVVKRGALGSYRLTVNKRTLPVIRQR